MSGDGVGALTAGEAFVDLSSWRKVAVRGGDAAGWLNDLISADVAGVGPGQARRSLLLSPTGRIRSEFTVAVGDGGPLLLQDPGRTPVDTLLSPYVLSSDVQLEDRTSGLALFAFPGRTRVPDVDGVTPSAPSCVGVGTDLLAAAEQHDPLLASLMRRYWLAGADDLETWRVVAGIPRFGVDALEDDLPEEGGFADAVSFDKGCYLGQEAVAKVRNLGHPRRVVLHLIADDAVSPGDVIEAAGEEAGHVTSARPSGGRWWLLATVSWRWRDGPFTSGDIPLAIAPRP
jgi:folate-binding protein YgfZ